MSLTAYTSDDKGTTAASTAAASAATVALQAAPKLRTGMYAGWKIDMEVYLSRIGAEGVHTHTWRKGIGRSLYSK